MVPARNRVALFQPMIVSGKSLRVEKAPTGIQCLSAYLKRAGFQTRMFHETVSEDVRDQICGFRPDLVGISSFTCTFPAAREMARRLKEVRPDLPIVLGGWHASGCVTSYQRGYEAWSLQEILNRQSFFDYVISGEGEEPLLALAEALAVETLRAELQSGLVRIPGLGLLDEDGQILVSPAKRCTDLGQLPWPDWDALDVNKYRDKRNTSILDLSVHAQRGCRFNCAFCQTPDLYPGKTLRMPPDTVVNYIEYLVDTFGPNTITFTDEDFLSDADWLRELSTELIRRELGRRVHFDTFAATKDIVHMDKLGVLSDFAQAGFQSFTVGIESFNPKTIEAFARPIPRKERQNPEEYLHEVQRAVDITRKHGLMFFGDYIFGYFRENEEEARAGFSYIKRLRNIPYMYMPTFTPFPGTALWQYAIGDDALIWVEGSIPWESYNCSSQVTRVPYDLSLFRDACEREFYESPVYLVGMGEDIARNPARLAAYYLPLFTKLSSDHPTDEALRAIQVDLSCRQDAQAA